MRKLKLQVQMSIDGFISGPNNEMDWLTFPWTDDINKFVDEITAPVDCIVLGRNLAEGFIPHWAGVAADPDNPEVTAGKKYTDTPKVVFTRNLEESKWENTTLAKGGLVEEITKLKNQEGSDIIAYGGGEFVSSLLKENLIDELYLFINPVIIGKGMPIFTEIRDKVFFKLRDVKTFDCGIVTLCYQLNR